MQMASRSLQNDEPLSLSYRASAHYEHLTLEQEQSLARRWIEQGDRQACDLLVGSHLRLVTKIAKGFLGYGLPLADLVGEGNLGLMRAISRFDPDKGFRLSTYAQWWIRAAIHEFILNNWSLVKLGTTGAQKKLFFNLKRLKARMGVLEDGRLIAQATAAIAVNLGATEAEVVQMENRLSAVDCSLNASIKAEDGSTEWQDILVDEQDDQETLVERQQSARTEATWLQEGLAVLTDRELDIFLARRLRDQPITLEELSGRYSVSRERIRQIEMRAFHKVREAVLTLCDTATHNERLARAAFAAA
jgi:RNA polymerase sigma-32 factor